MDYYRKHKGAVTLSLAGVLLVIITLFLLTGYLLTITVLAGFSFGSLTVWLTGELRDYPNGFTDIREQTNPLESGKRPTIASRKT